MDAQPVAVTQTVVHVPTATLPAPDVEIGAWETPWKRLLPLWRHAVWLMALFVLCAISVGVRLDVQKARIELDRNAAMQAEARIVNERLTLEYDARRRAVAMENVASHFALGGNSRVVTVGGAP